MTLKYKIIPVTAFMQNCCVLWDDDTKECIVTDVGGEIPKINQFIEQNHLIPRAIWLTHGHIDHISAVADFAKQHQIEILGPNQQDDFWIQLLPQVALQYHFPTSHSFEPTRWLNENDTVTVGKYQFKILHIPGHTPGSVVFYCQNEKLLIAGDVLFRESIGRTDFPKGNHHDLITNIKTKLFTLPDDVQVITGHGPMTSIGYEKQYNPFLR